MRSMMFAVCGWLLAAVPGWAVDYSRIDRKVGKEPAYQSKEREYVLLLFGREARVRVWLVMDGKTVYIDRDGNGDLTAPDERFAKPEDCRGVEIADPDGKTRYVITQLHVFSEKGQPNRWTSVSVDVKGPIEYRQYSDAELRSSPEQARISHFHGPLTVEARTISWKVPPSLALVTGDDPTSLSATVGTMDGRHGLWAVVRTHNGDLGAFPKGVHPVVDIEFPSKAPGGPTVKRQFTLHEFC